MSTFHFIIFHSIIRFISYFLPHFILIFNFVVIVVFFHRLFQVIINYVSCTRHCSTPNGHSKDALIDWYLLALDQSLVVFIIRFRRARIYPLLLVESPGCELFRCHLSRLVTTGEYRLSIDSRKFDVNYDTTMIW